MLNPFEDPDSTYLVLANGECQFSLWPAFVDVPPGWDVAFDQNTRQECLDFINEHWTDMRPGSIVKAMGN